MLKITYNGGVASIDLREHILRGEHPKQEIIKFVSEAKQGSVIEIHLPHRGQPLVAALESVGITSIVNQIEENHFRLMCVKI